MKRKGNALLLSAYALLFGLGIWFSIAEYYYSWQLWILLALLIVLMWTFIRSKAYLYALFKYQYICLMAIAGILVFAWYTVPHFRRLGIYPFALFGFLQAGIILLNSSAEKFRTLFVISFILVSLNLLPLLFYLSEGSLITRALINTLFISDRNESLEYLKGKFNSSHLLILSAFLTAAFLLFKRIRQVSSAAGGSYLLWFYLLSFLIVMTTGPLGALLSEYAIFRNDSRMMEQMVLDRKRGMPGKRFTVEHHPQEAKKILVIIGESLNRNMMSLYGYPLPTTPLLQKLVADTSAGKTYRFNNVISPETTTVPALRKILTNINNTNGLQFSASATLVDLFKQAGYETFWLSNQAFTGKYDRPNTVFAMTADHHFLLLCRPILA